MGEIEAIIIIAIVFRVLFAILGVWWRCDRRSDFRRDR